MTWLENSPAPVARDVESLNPNGQTRSHARNESARRSLAIHIDDLRSKLTNRKRQIHHAKWSVGRTATAKGVGNHDGSADHAKARGHGVR